MAGASAGLCGARPPPIRRACRPSISWGRCARQFAKWWIPDAVVFIEEVPKTSVGKFAKRDLRARFADYYKEDPSPEAPHRIAEAQGGEKR